jgi:hypothetical protein
MYKAAQGHSVGLQGVLGDLIDTLAKPPNERRVITIIVRLSGGYDPAKAQYRVVACYRKMDRMGKAREEYATLRDRYPFSDWTQQAAGEEGLAEPGDEPPTAAPEEPPGERPREPEEELTIVPLDE